MAGQQVAFVDSDGDTWTDGPGPGMFTCASVDWSATAEQVAQEGYGPFTWNPDHPAAPELTDADRYAHAIMVDLREAAFSRTEVLALLAEAFTERQMSALLPESTPEACPVHDHGSGRDDGECRCRRSDLPDLLATLASRSDNPGAFLAGARALAASIDANTPATMDALRIRQVH